MNFKKDKKKPFQKKKNLYNSKRNVKKYCVKISNLPNDITLNEMSELITPWSPLRVFDQFYTVHIQSILSGSF